MGWVQRGAVFERRTAVRIVRAVAIVVAVVSAVAVVIWIVRGPERRHREERAAMAETAARVWSAPEVQRQWAAASATPSPADDVVAGQRASSWVRLVSREGTRLTVEMVAPFCGRGYERHVLETDAVVVVWATGRPGEIECAAAVMREETLTLRAPIGDRPVVDHLGSLVLPDQHWRLISSGERPG